MRIILDVGYIDDKGKWHHEEVEIDKLDVEAWAVEKVNTLADYDRFGYAEVKKILLEG